MTENKKRFRIEFTIDVEERSDDTIKERANMLLSCMIPFPEDITFYEVENPWHTGTPPMEKGTYLIRQDCLYAPHVVCERKEDGGSLFIEGSNQVIEDGILAYQKIEPYKENKDGHTD